MTDSYSHDGFAEAEATQDREILSGVQRFNEEEEELERQRQKATEKRAAMRQDPHGAKDPSQFGLGENLTELKNAVVGGVRDTGSSIVTAPERLYDMATGEMAKALEETGEYTPDFNPFG